MVSEGKKKRQSKSSVISSETSRSSSNEFIYCVLVVENPGFPFTNSYNSM
jgi:hypothetical protein